MRSTVKFEEGVEEEGPEKKKGRFQKAAMVVLICNLVYLLAFLAMWLIQSRTYVMNVGEMVWGVVLAVACVIIPALLLDCAGRWKNTAKGNRVFLGVCIATFVLSLAYTFYINGGMGMALLMFLALLVIALVFGTVALLRFSHQKSFKGLAIAAILCVGVVFSSYVSATESAVVVGQNNLSSVVVPQAEQSMPNNDTQTTVVGGDGAFVVFPSDGNGTGQYVVIAPDGGLPNGNTNSNMPNVQKELTVLRENESNDTVLRFFGIWGVLMRWLLCAILIAYVVTLPCAARANAVEEESEDFDTDVCD